MENVLVKKKVIPNNIKWQENWSKIIFAFGDHLPPPTLNKINFVTNCLTWRIDWSKMIFEFGIHVGAKSC